MTIIDLHDGACDALLKKVARGDRSALANLFTSEGGRLLAIARRILRRRELAEEAVQDAFVIIWQRAPAFDTERGAARAWLTTIVRNRALNMLRDGSRLDFVDEEQLATFRERSGDAQQAYMALPETESLKRCLGQLDAPRRESILLSYVVGFSHGEIAAEMKAPVGTVKAWIRRGMISLQECLS